MNFTFFPGRDSRYVLRLYLKVAFIGLDHALTKPAEDIKDRKERTLARLDAIPGLLKQAIDNIGSVPETYYKAALAMIGDCKKYLGEAGSEFKHDGFGNFEKALQNVLSSLVAFEKFLSSISHVPDRRFAVTSLTSSLKDHFFVSQYPGTNISNCR